jgi:hypothetical protein
MDKYFRGLQISESQEDKSNMNSGMGSNMNCPVINSCVDNNLISSAASSSSIRHLQPLRV